MDTLERMDLYKKLCDLGGVSGHEKSVRKFMKEEISKYTDTIVSDNLGSVLGYLDGDGPTIMISGHTDEVGAMVVDITNGGFLKMIAIGGINPEVMVSQNVIVHSKNGEEIKGVVGAIPPHIGGSQTSFDDLQVDIGASSRDEVLSWGINVGCQITFSNNFYVMKDGYKVVSKAFDDRIGCGVALEVLKEAKNLKHPNKLYIGGTVQEEVGLRGAQTASNMIAPDLFITVDVSPVGDFLGKENMGKLGEGFLIRYYDPRCIMNPEITKYFEDIAKSHNIKYQFFKSQGGTDAAQGQYAGSRGALSTTVGMPGRYIHSTATIIDVRDLECVKAMVLAIIETFNQSVLERIQNGEY